MSVLARFAAVPPPRWARPPSRMDGAAWLAAAVLGGLAAVALLAPWIAPHDPNSVDLSAAYRGPSPTHLLGTDDSGRDLLSRLIVGSRTSLLGPLLVTVAAATAGTAVAVGAAWAGGRLDSVVARALDVALAFPALLLAIGAVVLFGTGFVAPVAALAVAYVPYVARLVRGAAVRERRLAYIEATTALGFSGFATCRRHLLPNVAALVLAQATICFGYSMVDLAAVNFLGLGLQPPDADWGVMVAAGQFSILRGHPQQSLYAGLLILVTVAAFTILGDRLTAVDRSSAG